MIQLRVVSCLSLGLLFLFFVPRTTIACAPDDITGLKT
jgi:hypothetical protein